MDFEFYNRLPGGFSFIAAENEVCVGKVHVSIDADTAKIEDIIVSEFITIPVWLLPFWKKKVTYRNKGVGTELLNLVIKKCSELGIEQLTGQIHGNEEKLVRWYQKIGFNVAGLNISLKIRART